MTTKEEYVEALERMKQVDFDFDGCISTMNKFKEDINLLTGLANVYFEEKQAIKSETNIEHYFEYLSEVGLGGFALVNGRCTECLGLRCSECDFSGCDCCNKRLRWLVSPYKKPPYKLSQFEFDLIQTYRDGNTDCKLSDRRILRELKDKEYFKCVDYDTKVKDILENCEVI